MKQDLRTGQYETLWKYEYRRERTHLMEAPIGGRLGWTDETIEIANQSGIGHVWTLTESLVAHP